MSPQEIAFYVPEAPVEFILPSQWAELHQPSALAPEQRLMLAVLIDAIRCYRESSASSRNADIRKETAEWFESDYSGPFSFLTICGEFNLNPDSIRRQLGGVKLSALRMTKGKAAVLIQSNV